MPRTEPIIKHMYLLKGEVRYYPAKLPFTDSGLEKNRMSYIGEVKQGSIKGKLPKTLRIIGYDSDSANSPSIPNSKGSKKTRAVNKCEKCCYCECVLTKSNITKEHLVPSSKGGCGSKSNIKFSCRECNEEKSNMLMEEFVKYLLLKTNSDKTIIMIKNAYLLLKYVNKKGTKLYKK